jgi:hypothetical protein
MPRDAFGREQDEDALESLGWVDSGDVPSPRAPAPAPVQTVAPPAAAPTIPSTWSPPSMRVPDLTPPRRRGGVAAVFGVVLLAAVVFAVIGIAGSTTSIHLPKIPKPDVGTPTADPPQGLDATSLLRRGNLSPALEKIQDKVGGKPRLLRIEAERIDMQVLANGKLVNVQWRYDADEPNVLSSSSVPASLPAFEWSQINASAPARLVRATTTAGRAKDFNYAVLLQADKLRWSAFTAAGRGFLATPKGRGVTPIGG